MVTLLKHGITIHSAAEGAIVQSAEVTAKSEENTVSGMVAGVTQIVKVFAHTATKEFSVSGKGDLTLSPGLGDNSNLSLITGGLTFIGEVKYSQKIGDTSDWSYSGKHYPSAA